MIKMSLNESEVDLVTRRSKLGVFLDKLLRKFSRYDGTEEEVDILVQNLRPVRVKVYALENILRKLRTKF